MRKVLIIVDKPNWAFDVIAKQIIKYNPYNELLIDIFYLKGNYDRLEAKCISYDLVFFMHWSLACRKAKPFLKKLTNNIKFRDYKLIPIVNQDIINKSIVGIHAHHDFDDRMTTPETNIAPPDNLVSFLLQFKAVNAVSKRLTDLFKNAGVNNVSYTPNGVDTDNFRSIEPLNKSKKLRVGYIGTRKRDWKEGISELVDPLKKIDFIDLLFATPEDNYISHDNMPKFLNSIDVAICTSQSEGFPLKVLEPSACGRPVISTRVGGSEDLIIDGENGYLVKRSINAFVEKLQYLDENRNILVEMGNENRKLIEKKWSWKQCSKSWLKFIESNVATK